MTAGGAPWPIVEGGSPQPGGYWVGVPAILAVAAAAAATVPPPYVVITVGMTHQPHELAQQVLLGPGAWDHQLGFICLQLSQPLCPQQLQQVVLWQCQYLWEEVPL